MHPGDRQQVHARRRYLNVELGRRQVEVPVQHAAGVEAVALQGGLHLIPVDARAARDIVDVAETTPTLMVEAEVIGTKQRKGAQGAVVGASGGG